MSNSRIKTLRIVDLVCKITGIKAKKIIDVNISTIFTRPSTIKALTEKEIKKIDDLLSFCRLFNEVDFINEKTCINSATKSQDFCKNIFKGITSKEYFKMILLDNQNNLIDVIDVSEGTISECTVFVREIIKDILNYDANAVIITHNHPSNSKIFSEADLQMTEKIKNAVNTINVRLLDHVLVTANGETESLASLGKL